MVQTGHFSQGVPRVLHKFLLLLGCALAYLLLKFEELAEAAPPLVLIMDLLDQWILREAVCNLLLLNCVLHRGAILDEDVENVALAAYDAVHGHADVGVAHSVVNIGSILHKVLHDGLVVAKDGSLQGRLPVPSISVHVC